MSDQHVGQASEVPEGEVRVFECGTSSIAVAQIKGEFYAIDNLCTHDNGPLGEGRVSRGRIICPRHGAAFDPQTGKALTLPAVRGVEAYEVSRHGDDLYVDCGPGAGTDGNEAQP